MDAEVARHVRLERIAVALDGGNGGATRREGRRGASGHAKAAGTFVYQTLKYTPTTALNMLSCFLFFGMPYRTHSTGFIL